MSNSPLTHLFSEELYNIPARVVVVISRSWETYSADDKVLIGKILGSVKLDLNSVQILQLASVTDDALAALKANKILVFGSQSSMKPYEVTQAQGFCVIQADDPSVLDDTKKKSLWIALRQMFGI